MKDIKGKNALISSRIIINLFGAIFRLGGDSVAYLLSKLMPDKYRELDSNINTSTDSNYGETVHTVNSKEEEICPEFQEIINIDENLLIGIEHLIRTPDETAVMRVVTNESFSKQYKRKVYKDFMGKYIKVDKDKLYLQKATVYLE